MDYPVPLAVEVPEMYGTVPPRSIAMWALHIRTSEVKVEGCEGFHRGSGMVCAPVKWVKGDAHQRSEVPWAWAVNASTVDTRT